MPNYDSYNPLAPTSPAVPGWGTGYDDMAGWGNDVAAGSGMTQIGGSFAPNLSGGAMSPMGAFASPKLGLNMGTANLALSGLSTIGNLWAAFNAQKLARQQFEYTKNVTDTNLANQIKTYNTTLTDRGNNRAKVEGHDAGWAQSYVDANALKRYGT